MTAYAAPIEIVQAALHRVGEAAITDLNDGSPPAVIAASNYEGIVADLLCRHAWSFATRTADLVLKGETTAKPWTHAFALPTDTLTLRKVTRCGADLTADDYELRDGELLALSDDALQAMVNYRAPENRWPGDFSECVVIRMQAIFLEGLLDKWQDARLKERDSEAKVLAAMTRDRRQRPGVRAERPRLAQVWRGRR